MGQEGIFIMIRMFALDFFSQILLVSLYKKVDSDSKNILEKNVNFRGINICEWAFLIYFVGVIFPK